MCHAVVCLREDGKFLIVLQRYPTRGSENVELLKVETHIKLEVMWCAPSHSLDTSHFEERISWG